MDILFITGMSFLSIIVLFLLTKLMGNKQVSQMTMFDYITGITIGSIAAEMATDIDDGFHRPLIAMLIYGLVAALLSVLSNKFVGARRFIDGTSLILLENGKLFKKNLKKAKLNINELLIQCRIMGYHNIADIQTAVLEPNGRISILPKASSRNVTNKDINLFPQQDKLPVTIILDGKILEENLKFTGNNQVWLKKQLDMQGVKNIGDVFYASCDRNNCLSVYTCVKEKPDRDIFL